MNNKIEHPAKSFFSATPIKTTMLMTSLLPPSRYMFQPIQCDDESDNSFDEDIELCSLSLHQQTDPHFIYEGDLNLDPYPYNHETSDELHDLHQFDYCYWTSCGFQCENTNDCGTVFASFFDEMSISREMDFDEDDASDFRDEDYCATNESDHYCLRDVFETSDLDASLRYHNSDDAITSYAAFSPTCVVEINYHNNFTTKLENISHHSLSQVSANAA